MIKSKILAIALKELGVILKKIKNREAYFPGCGYGGFANHSIIRIRKLVNCPRDCEKCVLGNLNLKVGETHLCSLRGFNLFSQIDSMLTVKGYDDAEKLIQPFIGKLETQLSDVLVQQEEEQEEERLGTGMNPFEKALFFVALVVAVYFMFIYPWPFTH